MIRRHQEPGIVDPVLPTVMEHRRKAGIMGLHVGAGRGNLITHDLGCFDVANAKLNLLPPSSTVLTTTTPFANVSEPGSSVLAIPPSTSEVCSHEHSHALVLRSNDECRLPADERMAGPIRVFQICTVCSFRLSERIGLQFML